MRSNKCSGRLRWKSDEFSLRNANSKLFVSSPNSSLASRFVSKLLNRGIQMSLATRVYCCRLLSKRRRWSVESASWRRSDVVRCSSRRSRSCARNANDCSRSDARSDDSSDKRRSCAKRSCETCASSKSAKPNCNARTCAARLPAQNDFKVSWLPNDDDALNPVHPRCTLAAFQRSVCKRKSAVFEGIIGELNNFLALFFFALSAFAFAQLMNFPVIIITELMRIN